MTHELGLESLSGGGKLTLVLGSGGTTLSSLSSGSSVSSSVGSGGSGLSLWLRQGVGDLTSLDY